MIFLVILILGLAAVLTAGWISYRTVFFSKKEGRENPPVFVSHRYDPYRPELERLADVLSGRAFEEVSIFAQDRWRLSGKYYHLRDGAPLVICFHGYRSNPTTDFSAIAELCTRLGCNVLLADQRAHGKSEGSSITFGIRERLDAQSWAEYAADRWPEAKIILYGVSMGGATVLMAANLELPENVKGIIADCPYSSPKAIISRVAEHQGKNARLLWPSIRLGAKIFGGFDILETTAAQAVSETALPILILHGEADLFVPSQMSADVQMANPEKVRRFTFPGAEHGVSIMADPDRYERCLRSFFGEVL